MIIQLAPSIDKVQIVSLHAESDTNFMCIKKTVLIHATRAEGHARPLLVVKDLDLDFSG